MTGRVRAVAHGVVRSARSLVRRPAFSALAVALFALGIAAITTVFAVVNHAMLRPLPYRDPDALFRLLTTEPTSSGATRPMLLGYFQFSRWRDETSKW